MLHQLKIALIYDKANTKYGGAEIVLKSLSRLFPDAPLFTSIYDSNQALWARDFEIKTSFLQNIPLLNKHHRLLAPLMPIAFESHNLDEYDILISISSGEAKGVITKPHQLHVCYMLTPPRYLYSHYEEYLKTFSFFSMPIIRHISKFFLQYLKWWDQAAAHRPDHLIAISVFIKKRIRQFYQREATAVIYPPFIKKLDPTQNKLPLTKFLLCISRLVPYKAIDLCILAAVALNETLVIVGSGPEEITLKKMYPKLTYVRSDDETVKDAIQSAKKAQKNIIFVGSVSDEQVADLMDNAKLLLMPGTEDFGITAIEAAAKGLLSLVSKESGVAEVLGNNCIKINRVTVKEIIDGIGITSVKDRNIRPSALKKIAETVSEDKFTSQFEKIVYDLFIQHRQKGSDVYL